MSKKIVYQFPRGENEKICFSVAPYLYTAQNQISLTQFQLMCGCLSIVGHSWPLWLRFHGGKGVATSAGVFFGIYPVAMILSVLVWIISAVVSRYVSLSSLISAASFPLWMVFLYRGRGDFVVSIALSLAVCAFIFYTHRSNLRRLAQGTENKIGKK